MSCREVVVDAASDDFYRQHMYNNYGEVGLSVKDMVDKFAAASAQHKQVSTVYSSLCLMSFAHRIHVTCTLSIRTEHPKQMRAASFRCSATLCISTCSPLGCAHARCFCHIKEAPS
jgi:hypothetical protein